MDSSPPVDERDAGYATAAALVFALALSLVATAFVVRSVGLLKLARADLARTQAEFGLDGAHLLAAATVVRSDESVAFRWSMPTDMGFADVVAEREADKLSLAAAASADDALFAPFGVADIATLRARLEATTGPAADVAALDPAPLWRACAASLISAQGQSQTLPPAPREPRLQPEDPHWRVGELWRIQVTTAAGWRDDRLVRFTGDARHPVAVVSRKLSRSDGGQGRCDAIRAAG